MNYLTGIDVSSHQWQKLADGVTVDFSRPPDWTRAARAGAVFGAVRATVGAWRDPTFERNWIGFKEAGLITGAYHVVVPDQAPDSQMAAFFAYVAPCPVDLPVVLDCELVNNCDNRKITSVIEKCVQAVERQTNREPIIYTNAGYWNYRVLRSSQWKRLPLWVANYTIATKPVMPADWTEWLFWQWSADGNLKGVEYGARSKSIDLDRFAGTIEDLRAFAGMDKPEQPKPAPELTDAEKVKIMWEKGEAMGFWP